MEISNVQWFICILAVYRNLEKQNVLVIKTNNVPKVFLYRCFIKKFKKTMSRFEDCNIVLLENRKTRRSIILVLDIHERRPLYDVRKRVCNAVKTWHRIRHNRILSGKVLLRSRITERHAYRNAVARANTRNARLLVTRTTESHCWNGNEKFMKSRTGLARCKTTRRSRDYACTSTYDTM